MQHLTTTRRRDPRSVEIARLARAVNATMTAPGASTGTGQTGTDSSSGSGSSSTGTGQQQSAGQQQPSVGSTSSTGQQHAGQGQQQGTGDGGQHGAAQGQQTWRMEDLPEGARSYIQGLRDEAASHRTRGNTAETQWQAAQQAVAEAFGLRERPTPEQLGEQLRAAQAQTRQAQVENAVMRAAPSHGADPAALLDSRAFLERTAALDPTAQGFADQVSAAVRDEVTRNPRLRAQAADTGQQARGGRGMGQGATGSGGTRNGGMRAGRDLYAERHGRREQHSSTST
ncbi:hypothetical protein GCM10023201_41020 [Actinomycetospora corticicola]|uniref:Uncharacterized protein n=1 Tax=Actinomycetospora corticicola TaxID=663602 RepID=A0A7Y9DWH2_9PSEU|nr:hypothetical protein [Actinomycetospora corticicola]NYD36813.1 hypothetical protein [Actinomycetospora corticicola]